MTTAYFRVIQVGEDGEVLLMPFEGLEESGHDIVGARLLGKKPTRVHPVIWRNADESLSGSFFTRCPLERLKGREGEGKSRSTKELPPIDWIHWMEKVIDRR